MQYSLRHRFCGALLGAVLGETLGTNCCNTFTAKPVPWLTIQHWGFAIPDSGLNWSGIAINQVSALVHGETGKVIPASGCSSATDQTALVGLAVATLPIALFYHEDWYRLRDALEQMASAWQIARPITSALVVAYTISLALRERLHLNTLIPRLITDLELYDRDPQFMTQLNLVQTWVKQKIGVTVAKSQIEESCLSTTEITAVIVALYGFLSTPTDFQLSLLRTAQMLYQSQVSCAIVGALSGAYNGIASIPFSWRRAFNSTGSLASLLPSLASEADLLRQADLLWATWSGAHNPADWLQQSLHPTIASPHLIRPRY